MPRLTRCDSSALLEEGERLHAHLLTHFDDMIGDRMKYFDIHYTCQGTSCNYEYVSNRYGSHIKEAIRPWILEEHKSGRLFERDQWRPFRDQCDYYSMYYGYRRLFIFHDILYFQLTIRDILVDEPDGTLGQYILFEAALYGWKEEGEETLKPRRKVVVGDQLTDHEWYLSLK